MKMRIIALLFLLVGWTDGVSHAKEQVTNTPPGRPWLAKADLNGDGAVSVDEAQKAEEMWLKNASPKPDLDNNPPGPKGGPGSDWEKEDKQAAKEAWEQKKAELKEKREEFKEEHPNANPPGPVGGPGAGPRFDNDNNPPGLAGGPGTNWENKPVNPPGPVGGPGAGPHFDKDNNPPGLVGGVGTNWENKPGPQGGPGAGPDKVHRGGDGPRPGNSGGFAKKKK